MTSQDEPKKKHAFVVSPIGTPGSEVERNANLALKYIFKKALDPAEWNVHRADDGEKPDSIGHHVIRSIVEADLVIADLTGHNPNVFYELAVAHGFRKPVVHLITEGQKIPFDLSDQRTISYDLTDPASVDTAIRRLSVSAQAALADPNDLITPLTSFDSFDTLRQSLRDKSTTGDALADVLEQITDRMSALESRILSATRPLRSDGPLLPSNSHVKHASVIFDDPLKLGEFLRGELTESLPLGVLIATAKRAEKFGFVDFDATGMSRSELDHHLSLSRQNMLESSEATDLYKKLLLSEPFD